jgi:arylsulfatase A-like enzyme/tetratricopeptide (TPR) repeat protein
MSRYPVLLTLLAAGALAAAAAAPPAAGRPDLLLVSIDTLRADRVGCLGHARPTTPAIDALARRGLLFPDALSPVPLTLPAHATLLSGLEPWEHGVRDNANYSLSPGVPLLQERLAAAGYDTAAFVSAYVLASPFGLARGFGRYDELSLDVLRSGGIAVPERPSAETVAAAGEWLRARGARPFFAWVHLYDPHAPYDPPPPFDAAFQDPYDGEVACADARLAELVRALPRPERTWIAVVSDHGEGLGDHGEATHGAFLYPSTVRVLCLLVPPPGGGPAGRSRRPARLADLAATLLARANLPPLPGSGADLLAEPPPVPRPRTMETLYPWLHHGLSPLRGLVDGNGWYVLAPREELYDTQADSGLTRNLAEQRPAEARRLRAALARAFKDADGGGRKPSGADDGDALLSLGYLTGGRPDIPPMGKWKDLPDPKDRRDYLNGWEQALGLIVAGRPEAARDALEALRRKYPGDAEALKVLGDLDRRERKYAAALERYRAALAAAPGLHEVRIKLVQVLIRLGRPAEARTELERYAAAIPGDPLAAYYRGLLDAQEGRHAEALRAYADARARGYDAPELDWRRSLSLLALGRRGDAEAVLRGLTAYQPGYAPAWYSLGTCALEAGDAEAAKGHWERAVRLEPGLLPAKLDLAQVKRTLGDPPGESLALVRAVTALDPSNAGAWELEGDLCALEQDAAGARRAYGRALALPLDAAAGERVRRKVEALPPP